VTPPADRRPEPLLSPIQIRELSLAALVDVRTFERILRGDPVKHNSRERITRVLAARGMLDLLPRVAPR